MQRPKGHLSIKEVAEVTGLHMSLLRIWEIRHRWPAATRDRTNGYRWYSQATVELLKAFDAAGRPFKDIQDGVWMPKPDQNAELMLKAKQDSSNSFRIKHANAGPLLVEALLTKDERVVREWLASMGRLHPFARGPAITAMRDTPWCRPLLMQYGIPLE